MSIRSILRDNPLVLAPMAGITDLPFRTICRELGAGLLFSEMLSAEALIRSHSRTETMLRTGPAERPLVFQIFGGRPDSLAKAARMISRSGADFIDINMGCPVPKVLKSGSGSALLKDPERAREIMSAVVEASELPVTIKIRLGWDAHSIIAVELAQAAEQAGIAAVTVHARTRSQGFSGNADWNMIRTVKHSVGIPVIGNGDVRTARDAQRMLDETGCDGVMIGRACQGYPWIFREARQFLADGSLPLSPTPAERGALAVRHLGDMTDLLGEMTGVREMRKHLCWYSRGLPGGAEFRTRVNHLHTTQEVVAEIELFFASLAHAAPAPALREDRQ